MARTEIKPIPFGLSSSKTWKFQDYPTLENRTITLPSDAIWIEFGVNCVEGSLGGCRFSHVCRYALRMFAPPVRAAEVLIVILTVLILAILTPPHNWRSGVSADPWSIASITSMISSDGELLQLLRASTTCLQDRRQNPRIFVKQVLDGRRFRLGFSFQTSQPPTGNSPVAPSAYGIRVVPPNTDDNTPIRPTVREPRVQKPQGAKKGSLFRTVSPATWELVVRILALLFIIGLMSLVLNYETTVGVNSGFENFMNSQTVGVRILFAAFGTIIDAFWNHYFSCGPSLRPDLPTQRAFLLRIVVIRSHPHTGFHH